MPIKCSCENDCIVNKNNIKKKINELNQCPKCEDISIKKFSPLKDLIDFNKLNSSYKRCSCGKRPIDIVMSHILKIMIEEKIVPENGNLRRNSPVPLQSLYYSSFNPQFIGEKSLILIHPEFNKKVAERLLNEVSEVKGILKGNPEETVGILKKGKTPNCYELLGGCDIQADILRTLIKDEDSLRKIIINKKQSQAHIEVATTSKEKLMKVYNYLENNEKYKNNPNEFTVLDGMCGTGSIGIFLLMYGFKEVIFNDIWIKAIESTLLNLEINGFKYKLTCKSSEIAIGNTFKVYNEAIENLEEKIKVNLAIIDPYPNVDIDEIKNIVEKIADDILII